MRSLLLTNLLIVLLLISAVQSKSRDDSGLSNDDDSVDAKIAKLEQINTTIHEVITTAGHNPHQEILTKYFPDDAQLINDYPDWVERCYSSSVNGKTMSIFEESIGSVVHQYLHKSLLKHDNVTHDSIFDRVTALLDNMHQLGLLIIECVKGQKTGQKPTKIGLTKFAEMSAEDIRSIYKQPLEKEDNDDEIEKHILGSSGGGAILGRQRGKKINGFLVENSRFEVNSFSKNYPEAFDYRDQFVVGPVKDQGTCGLCFLFGIMAAIESSYMLKHGKQNISFSEKDLVDCMVEHHYYPGTAKMVVNKKVQMDPITGKPIMVPSCRPGGQQKKVLLEAKHTGLTLLSQGDAFVRDIALGQGFPFKPENCGHDPIVTKVTGWATQKDIPEDEDFLKAVLTKYGPVSTVFRTDLMVNGKTNDMVFFMIKEKMHYECDASTGANHVMTIIGWEKDYWIIRNSYGNYKDDGRKDQPAIDQAWGVEGVLYLDKKVAKSCGIFGPGSVWYFPEVE